MSIHLSKKLCRGCGVCLEVCPGDLLTLGPDDLVQIEEPERCWGCAACLKSCPHQAIGLYLHPALGGQGLIMTVTREKIPSDQQSLAQDSQPSLYRLRWRVTGHDFVREFLTEPGQTRGY
ncbi:MAG: ferredoxin family protein [Deltaproteobacteria bacterium]|jgi:adenylylsulfate reductase subunit B|nr:ferredoxin family protein [Deltaproteobacteria bacterium]